MDGALPDSSWRLLYPFRPYPLQEKAGGLVVGVLGNEFALEGALEDGLAETVGLNFAAIDCFI